MLNKVVLMGRLTADPELKATTNRITVTSFCIAVDRRFQPKEGEKQTDFINCVAWKNTAEFICKFFKRGDLIAVAGEIQTRKFTDRNGNNRVATEVVIDEASFCGSKNNSDSNSGEAVTDPADFEVLSNGEDLPF